MKKLISLLFITLSISCNSDDIINPTTQDAIDVYVAGSKNNQACYWKNNELVMLDSQGLSDQITTKKIIVSNNDVYVFGTAYFPNTDRIEYLFWKNNILTNLSTTYLTSNATVLLISDMEIVDNDVYFLGYIQEESGPKIAYWKNGQKIVLNSVDNLIDNPKIKVFNNDIYITGKENGIEGYYVNGIFNALENTFLNGLTIKNNEVYVFGGKTNGTNGYYKNITTGTETILSTSNIISKLEFDMNNDYYSNSQEIYGNNTLIHAVPSNAYNIYDFSVLNGNLYLIENFDTNGLPKVLKINNIIAMTSSIDEDYISLFIDQN